MLLIYYIAYGLIILLTMPLAGKNLAFAYSREPENSYSALMGLGKGYRKVVYFSFILIFAILVAQCVGRDELIADYQLYKKAYEAGGQINTKKGIEYTFYLLTLASPEFLILLLFYALLSVSTHLIAILKNSPNIWLAMILYVGYTFVLHDMIQMRCAVAAGIFLISIRYIQERRWVIYYLLVALAISFHYSAIVFIPLYFLPKRNMNRIFWVSALMFALIFSVFDIRLGNLLRYIPIRIIELYLKSYLGSREYSEAATGPMRIAQCLLTMYMIINVRKYQRVYPFATISIAIYTCSLLVYLLFGDIPVLQGRLGELLGVSGIYMWAMFPMINRRYYYFWMIIPIIIALYNNMTAYTLLSLENQI